MIDDVSYSYPLRIGMLTIIGAYDLPPKVKRNNLFSVFPKNVEHSLSLMFRKESYRLSRNDKTSSLPQVH